MWKDKLNLANNETLQSIKSDQNGFLAQEDVELYHIINSDGKITGKVVFTDHTAINGFRRTLHVIQKDITGTIIIDESWTVRNDSVC
jgi:hypothetical protein